MVGHSCQVYKDAHYRVTTDSQATGSKLTLSDLVLTSTLTGETEVQRGWTPVHFGRETGLGGPLDPAECEGAWCLLPASLFSPSQHLPSCVPQDEGGPPMIREGPSRTRKEPT